MQQDVTTQPYGYFVCGALQSAPVKTRHYHDNHMAMTVMWAIYCVAEHWCEAARGSQTLIEAEVHGGERAC